MPLLPGKKNIGECAVEGCKVDRAKQLLKYLEDDYATHKE